jgi:hypothetical protein
MLSGTEKEEKQILHASLWPVGLTLVVFADAITSCYGAIAALSPATLAPGLAGHEREGL